MSLSQEPPSARRRLRSAAARFVCACAAAFALSGCLSRVLEIRSDPPGAQVYINGQPVGTTPAVYKFDQYGDRALLLTCDEYASVSRTCALEAPWWGCFPCDLFVELWPGQVVDKHEASFTLQKAASADADLDALFKNLGATERAMHAEER